MLRTKHLRLTSTSRVLVLAQAAAVVLLGCAPAEHRIPLKDFLAQAQVQATPSSAPAPEVMETLHEQLQAHLGAYRPGPGDLLGITLVTTDLAALAPTMQVRIGDEGNIKLPIVGLLPVADRSFEEIEAAIRNAYTNGIYRDATVTVAVIEPKLTEVLVRGAVTQPGLIGLPRHRRNILFAIVRAGGVSEMASGIVTLHRLGRNEDERELNLYDIEDLRTALALDPLANGDVITVRAAAPNTIFVGGLVNSPHPQMYPMGTEATVLQAIAGANGLRTDVTPREGTLIRRLPDGREVHVKLDLDRISRGIDPNLTLAGGDILWVPETDETRVQDWINRHIFFRAGLSATAGTNYNASAVDFLNDNAREMSTSGKSNGTLQDKLDPFGFLLQSSPVQQAIKGQVLPGK